MSSMGRLWLLAHRFPASLRLWRTIYSQITDIYQYLNLIFGSTTPQLPPSHSCETAEALLTLLKARTLADTSEEKLKKLWDHATLLLQQCPELNSLCEVQNNRGFNALLVSVINNDIDVLEMLVREGCDVNRGKCTLPLHLACCLGNTTIVTFLLSNGACLEQEAGMCYPRDHQSIRHMPSRFHFLETDVFHCDSDHTLPLMYAIQYDQIDVVEVLLEHAQSTSPNIDPLPYSRFPLHFACRHGSFNCIIYLLRFDDEVNQVDDHNMTPLLYVVKWGEDFVKVLVESGADVMVLGNKNNSALHIFYEDIKDPLQLYKTSRYLLATGVEQLITETDNQSNNALHIVMDLVNRLYYSFGDENRSSDSSEEMKQRQNEWNEQVLDTIKLLLDSNCDPNAVNDRDVTPMHKLFLMLDFILSNESPGVTVDMSPVREKYQVDLNVLHSVLKLLLNHNADPNIMTSSGRTPLMLLLHMLLGVDPAHITELQEGVLDCVILLCSKGARPSIEQSTHVHMVRMITKLGHRCIQQRDEKLQSSMCEFFTKLLAALLKHGLDSNYCTQHRQRVAEGGSGNLLLEVTRLAQYVRQPIHLNFVYEWVLTLLQWGTNPDLEPYPSEPEFCSSQSHIYLRELKGNQPLKQYMDNVQDLNNVVEGEYAERLLMLFYNSMDHKALFHCMTMSRLQSRFDPNRSSGAAFIELINQLLEKPRSLQQIARVAIYKATDRKLTTAVPQLLLPNALKKYLLLVQ